MNLVERIWKLLEEKNQKETSTNAIELLQNPLEMNKNPELRLKNFSEAFQDLKKKTGSQIREFK